jgi:hypothetical protein
MVTIHLRLVTSLRVRGAVPPLPTHIYSIVRKHRNNSAFTFWFLANVSFFNDCVSDTQILQRRVRHQDTSGKLYRIHHPNDGGITPLKRRPTATEGAISYKSPIFIFISYTSLHNLQLQMFDVLHHVVSWTLVRHKGVTLLLRKRSSQVQMWGRKTAIPTEVYRSFPQTFHANAEIIF